MYNKEKREKKERTKDDKGEKRWNCNTHTHTHIMSIELVDSLERAIL